MSPQLLAPGVLLIDADDRGDALERCTHARDQGTRTIVTVSSPEQAPRFVKAGCDAILLKPFQPLLLTTRLSLLRRVSSTLRRCFDVKCPRCSRPGAVAFEHHAQDEAWYACVMCESAWTGKLSKRRV